MRLFPFSLFLMMVFASCINAVENAPLITLHPCPSTVRIGGPDGVRVPPASDTYRLAMARGESESFQVAIQRKPQKTGSPMRVRVWCKPILQDDIQPQTLKMSPAPVPLILYQVLDINYTGPADNSTFHVPPGNEGWVPDVCLPIKEKEIIAAQTHTPDRITLLVTVPDDPRLTSSRYTIRVAAPENSAMSAQLVLKVTVLPVDIPKPFDFMTGVTWNYHIERYLGRKLTEVERKRYIDFFLDYRFTPAWFFSRGTHFTENEIRHIVSRGGNIFQVYHIGGGGKRLIEDKDKEKIKKRLTEWRKIMVDAGAIEYCYALIGDEPDQDSFPVIRKNALWLKSVFPELKIWVASRPVKELLDVVDAWDVVTAHSTQYYAAHSHTDATQKMAQSALSKPVYWWFFSVEPYRPHMNVRLDNPLSDARAIGWMSFLQGVDGFEYFWATDWAGNADLKDVSYPQKAERWNSGLSGAGQLCYPGEDGLPIPSLRLVNLRDAMEDWALFRMAGDALKKRYPNVIRDPRTLQAVHDEALRIVSKKR